MSERPVDVDAMIEACERAGRAYRETGERIAERIERFGREASAAATRPRKAPLPWWERIRAAWRERRNDG